MKAAIPFLQHSLTPLQSLIARSWRPQWVCRSCRHRQQPQWRRMLATSSPSTPASERDKPFYITTPIFYVNAAPHVGHMYTMILADVLKRWQQLKGRRAILLTGIDEHGMKIQRAAFAADLDPKEFCDKGADVFSHLARQVDMSNDIFMRTTEERHKDGVQYAWTMLQERGYIYESKHEGWYSVSDETFYPQSQVQYIVDPPTGRKIMASIETGKEVEWTSERNYHFRLSAFRERLLAFYESNPDYIVPRSRMKEVVNQVKAGLEDLSISRPVERLTWGVQVPTDSSQTIYVWLDALLNYATAVGYPFTPGSEALSGWPVDVQVVGKDIVRFHCIYWPAFLMALDLPLHKQVLTHAHWTLGKQKMAKSTGNVVNPFFALERFGIDPLRWFLILEGGISDDADYDNSFVIDKYKKGLQGGLGNLTSRIMRGKGWDVHQAIKRHATLTVPDVSDDGKKMFERLRTLPGQVDGHMQALHPNKALRTIMGAVYDMNAYLQQSSPWTLVTKLRSARADNTGKALRHLDEEFGTSDGQSVVLIEKTIEKDVYLAAETLRLAGIMLQPFIPGAAQRLLDMVGVDPARRGFGWAQVGADDSFGIPSVAMGKGVEGVLFPPLTSDF